MTNKIRTFQLIAFLVFLMLATGLFYTQIVRYPYYKALSEKNRVRALPLEAPRGNIYDRKGKLLVSNRLSFDVEVIFQEVKDTNKVLDLLHIILNIDRNELSKKIEEAKKNPFIPVKIVEDIEKSKAIQLEETKLKLPGVIITTRPMRKYLYGSALCHVIGYLGMISEQELRKYKTYGYRMRDFVGKDGIERRYNDYLRGINGGLQVEVDNRGRQIDVLAIKEPRQGKELHLTIDLELQKYCDELLADKKGAIIAINPLNGDILALVSHPDFDPNIFVKSGNTREVLKLLSDKESPMLNRAISGAYPPGSVFKVVLACEALESAKFNERKTFSCSGSYRVGNRVYRCWREKGHGALCLVDAIKYSCNVFFYQLGLVVGVDDISNRTMAFGFGKPTGIDLPGEVSGLVPTKTWKRRKMKERWFKGETANYAIGQGYLLVTPIQILYMMSAIANEKGNIQPHIVKRIEEVSLSHHKFHEVDLRADTLRVVKEGLKQVVNGKHGTGMYARMDEVVVAGKTGTAQNPIGKSHGWFTAFAPFDNPKFCLLVFLEHGGKGGLDPARFAKKVIEEAKRLELL